MLVNDKDELLYYNVAIHILVQSEEEYSLIWKGKQQSKTIFLGRNSWFRETC